jgi:hypothetical protein
VDESLAAHMERVNDKDAGDSNAYIIHACDEHRKQVILCKGQNQQKIVYD